MNNSFERLIRDIYHAEIIENADSKYFLKLVNRIEFYGRWLEGFDKNKTRPALFLVNNLRPTLVNMMQSTDQFRLHHQTDHMQLIQLMYRTKDEHHAGIFTLNIAKPKNFNIFLNELDTEKWSQYLSQLTVSKGDIFLPRFMTTKNISLIPMLRDMGINHAFSNVSANFNNMVDRAVYIKGYNHSAQLSMDAHGTKGSAETKVTMYLYGRKPKPKFQMRVNRPFFFTIEDTVSGLILYMGIIRNPNKQA